MPGPKWRRLGVWWGGLLCLLLARTVAAAPAPATTADSLRSGRFWQWPEPVQLRVAGVRLDAGLARRAETMVHHPGLARRVKAQLLFQLGKFYFFDIQPSLALMRFLECQKLVSDNPAMRCAVEIELSYAYQWTRQPRTGLAHARTALRQARALHDVHLQDKAYNMMAICADELPDKPLALRYYLESVRLSRRRASTLNLAIAQNNVAQAYFDLKHYAQAAQWLDSTKASLQRGRLEVHSNQLYNDEFMQVGVARLSADLARQRGHYQEAVQLLLPKLPGIRQINDRFLEIDVLKALVPALEGLGRYREALGYQQRLGELQSVMFEESNSRRAQEMQVMYQTQEQEQRLLRQRQRIANLQARTQLREAELTRRTTLFLAVLAGAGLMLVLVLVRQRARRILETTAATLRVRNRIAADLHDEVGTLLTRVNLQAELLRQQQPDPALDRLLTNSRAAASTMRDIVWSIDTQADTIGGLLDRMRDHLDQTATPAGLATELHIENLPDATPLTPELRQHLYLIFKEAVTNAAKHAHLATRLRVTLQHEASQLLLTVQDNGQAAARTSRSGMGLRNMEQRAEALGGTLRTGPAPAGGFGVELRAPF